MPEKYICEITEATIPTDNVHALTFISAELAERAHAGQFLHIKCGDERILRRPFGICRVYGNTLKIVFEVKGEGTRWLAGCKAGDMLDVIGPLGNGFRIPDGNIIVVGGGLGSPPMLFAAESAKHGVTAILGFRDAGRVILLSEFEAVCDSVFLTTDDGSLGSRGQLTQPLEELLAAGGCDAVLACGQLVMQRAVAELCGQYGTPCQVSLEERMGCGIGACLVCACQTRNEGRDRMSRVCRDGPVFDATEVVWSGENFDAED